MAKTQGKVHSIISNLVLVKVEGPVSQNEICFIQVGAERLMAEVIKVVGDLAYVQVFESTRGLKPGMLAEFENHMLEVTLGPGLLSKNFDGLQNDLDKMTGVFLKRGEYTNPLEDDKKWSFTPLAKVGDKVKAADWLANVKENWLDHKIMVPFKMVGEYTVASIAAAGEYTIKDTIAVLKDAAGKEYEITMVQKWPVKMAVRNYVDKPRPFRQMETGVRVIEHKHLSRISLNGLQRIESISLLAKLRRNYNSHACPTILRIEFKQIHCANGLILAINLSLNHQAHLPSGIYIVLLLDNQSRELMIGEWSSRTTHAPQIGIILPTIHRLQIGGFQCTQTTYRAFDIHLSRYFILFRNPPTIAPRNYNPIILLWISIATPNAQAFSDIFD